MPPLAACRRCGIAMQMPKRPELRRQFARLISITSRISQLARTLWTGRPDKSADFEPVQGRRRAPPLGSTGRSQKIARAWTAPSRLSYNRWRMRGSHTGVCRQSLAGAQQTRVRLVPGATSASQNGTRRLCVVACEGGCMIVICSNFPGLPAEIRSSQQPAWLHPGQP